MALTSINLLLLSITGFLADRKIRALQREVQALKKPGV